MTQAFIGKAVTRSCNRLQINEGVSNVENLGYYNGKFGPLNEMSIPMNDRVHWFGDGVYDAGPARNYKIFAIDEHIDRFMGPAGLTGLWQVEKRGEAGKLSAEERKQLDIQYAKNFSFGLDIKIILKTVTAFVQKENV